ncbi:MAG: hypothetical protein BYD32DRAFT_406638, partial [Podila humilis]
MRWEASSVHTLVLRHTLVAFVITVVNLRGWCLLSPRVLYISSRAPTWRREPEVRRRISSSHLGRRRGSLTLHDSLRYKWCGRIVPSDKRELRCC